MQKYLTDLDLAERYGVSRITVWRWAGNGNLPKPKKLGPNTTRWDVGEIEEFERKREAAA